MNKEEILNRAKKENKIADEWEVDVQKNANIIALILLVAIIGIMLMFSTIQIFQGVEPFANPFIFLFLLFIIMAIQSFVLYFYNKKILELVKAIIGIIVAIYSIIHFIY